MLSRLRQTKIQKQKPGQAENWIEEDHMADKIDKLDLDY